LGFEDWLVRPRFDEGVEFFNGGAAEDLAARAALPRAFVLGQVVVQGGPILIKKARPE